jgi:hypothetical protein
MATHCDIWTIEADKSDRSQKIKKTKIELGNVPLVRLLWQCHLEMPKPWLRLPAQAFRNSSPGPSLP